jgi:hypothetical protein
LSDAGHSGQGSACYSLKRSGHRLETRSGSWGTEEGTWDVERALRNHNVWLVLAYLGLILLMARTYA